MPCIISSPSEIRRALGQWFDVHKRDLPWRRTHDAYAIWLSEVILQQTRVVQGLDYYHRFLTAYPTLPDLAAADEQDVLHLWQGLGYYSRGRNLLRAARMVMERHEGSLPDDYDALRALPGIGDYTAAAVISFAYGKPYACVDGNVYRVLSRLGCMDTPIDTPEGKKVFRHEADALLDKTHPARHNQAMMELGALVCTPKTPQCEQCPVSEWCAAYKLGMADQLPIKQGKIAIKERVMNFFFITQSVGDEVYTWVRRRPAGDVWQGLYDIPLVEPDANADDLDWTQLLCELPAGGVLSSPVYTCKHLLTHRRLIITFYRVELPPVVSGVPAQFHSDYFAIPMGELRQYPFPKPLNTFFDKISL